MFCTACAAPNPPVAHACARCGASLRFEPASPARRAALVPPARAAAGARGGDRLRRVLYVVPLVTLLVSGALAGQRYRTDRDELARWYRAADAAAAAGRYVEAIDAYAQAGDYRDAAARRAATVAKLAPYRAAYLEGVAALDTGRYDDAIASLIPVARDLPTYENAASLLAEARRRRATALDHEAATAETRHDWLTAERDLVALAADDPDDDKLAARLAALRRAHAPLVFTRGHALYVVGPDLTDERLLTDAVPVSWPVWNPDRTRIAFVSADPTGFDRNAVLDVIGAEGGGLTQLAAQISPYAAPVWSPDGRAIAYSSFAGYDAVHGHGTVSLRAVDVATRRETDLTGDTASIALSPSWSPAGDRIAFVSRALRDSPRSRAGAGTSDVLIATVATGAVANVSRGRLPDAFTVAWSPVDDRLLVYSRKDGAYFEQDRTAIHLLDVQTGALTNINTTARAVSPPCWAPDGSRFAYVDGESVVRIRSAGRGEAWINVASAISGFLTWSPDGTALLAAADQDRGTSFIIPVGSGPGSQATLQLTYDAGYPYAGPPQWAPTNPVPAPAPASVSGTARDPGPERPDDIAPELP